MSKFKDLANAAVHKLRSRCTITRAPAVLLHVRSRWPKRADKITLETLRENFLFFSGDPEPLKHLPPERRFSAVRSDDVGETRCTITREEN